MDALLPGESELSQLQIIFEKLGTPSLSDWPSDSVVPFAAFECHEPQPLTNLIPRLVTNSLAHDLISNLLLFDQHARIRASEALEHDWFVGDSENIEPRS